MAKQNCWEVKKCGREPGGPKTAEFGVCPAATNKDLTGINSGKNAGRACWVLAGTLCGGAVQGTFATKLSNCMKCEFYQQVADEEGASYKSSKVILAQLKVKS
jgi:broad specificity polyphosphatase/5'/3'-nucleotidase SurE